MEPVTTLAVPTDYDLMSDRELLILMHQRLDTMEKTVNTVLANVQPFIQSLESSPIFRMFGKR